MAPVVIRCLGTFEVTVNAELVAAFPTDKVRALLAYLALESRTESGRRATRPHRREALAGLFWPHMADAAALSNLRLALHRLRQALDRSAPGVSDALLTITRQTVQLNHAALASDAITVQELLAKSAAHPHADPSRCDECLDRLAQAADLYHGELLAGFGLADAPAFEEWLLLRREMLHQQALMALHTLAEHYLSARRWALAAAAARRQIELDRWREDAHRQLMRALVGAGERAAALAAYQYIVQQLHDDLGITPDDETTALADTIRDASGKPSVLISELSAAQLRDQNQALERSEASERNIQYRHTLPSPLTQLVGREDELAQIVALLKNDHTRLVTIVGTGGVGKTSLAVLVATVMLEDNGDPPFADGVCFVDLSAISDPGLVTKTIAQALAIRETGTTPLLTRLKDYLKDRQLLLVLDNFEQVLSVAPLLAELLTACPRLKALVTSRIALRLHAEYTFLVAALPLPPFMPLPDLKALAASPAVALFVQRGQAVLPSFQLSTANAHAVAEICIRLDGLPLAIELAAARLRLLTPQELLARLAGSGGGTPLRLLTAGAWDAPARQQTLHHTIAWSEQLLDETLRTLFARLGVFVGGCTAEAAEAVCGGCESEAGSRSGGAATPTPTSQRPTSILDGLAALLDHNLLRQELGVGGAPRIRMLSTIREYALEQLEARGESDRLRQQHAAYYLTLAEAAEPQLQGADQTLRLDRLEVEHDNLRAALAWSLEDKQTRDTKHETQAGNPPPPVSYLQPSVPNLVSPSLPASLSRQELGLRLAAALGEFWWPRGHLSEGRRWLARVLEWSDAPPAARAKALYRAGELAYGQGDYSSATALLEQSLALYRQIQDTHGLACVLRGLGNTRSALGDEAQAATLRAESLALFREIRDAWGIGWMLLEIGRTERDPARQTALLEQSLALARGGGYKRTIATALGNLGKLAHSNGQHAQAGQLLQEALALGRELRDTWIIVWMLTELGLLARDQGDEPRATALLHESLALFRDSGNKGAVADVLGYLGDMMRRQGNYGRATELYQESLAVVRDLADAPKCAAIIRILQELAFSQGTTASATGRFEKGGNQAGAQFDEWCESDPRRLGDGGV